MSPVWERISASLDPAARLLVVIGPKGAGRRRVARSWLGESGQLVDFSGLPAGTTPATAVRRVLDVLNADPASRVAAVLPPAPQAFELSLRTDAQLIRGPDLFLTVTEIERHTAELRRGAAPDIPVGGPAPKSSVQLWQLTGGWLHGVEMLLRNPACENEAARSMARAVAPWAAYMDPTGLLAESAFLPSFSEGMLKAFYARRAARVPVLAQLGEACLIHPAPGGRWNMADLARRELRASVQRRDPDRAEQLDTIALTALARAGEPVAAIRAAVERRAWRALWTVLEEHWVDLYTSNPSMLRYAAQELPAGLVRSEHYAVGLRLLASVGQGRVTLPYPAGMPGYQDDQTAQVLRKLTDEYGRQPGAIAVTAGLVEVIFVRSQGHYVESGHSGERLRRLILRTVAVGKSRPSLAGMAELHCGISLHLADRFIEAANAYETAIYWGGIAGNAFIQANAASNLALIHAQGGNTQAARGWADRAEALLIRVHWGTNMVGRGARLARAFIAWHELDREKMEAALRLLPEEPDNDDFWAVHTELLTLRDTYFGSMDAGLHRITNLRGTRTFSARSPLAVRALGHAEFAVRALLGTLAAGGKPSASSPELSNLHAYMAIQLGNTDAALTIVHRTLSDSGGGWRVQCLARNLQLMAAAGPGPLDSQGLETVRRNYAAGGELIDLLWLWQAAPNRVGLRNALRLTSEQIRRIECFSVSCQGRVEGWVPLTDREVEVLGGLRRGKTRMEMAAERHVSVNTVKAQTRSLYRKLGVATRHEALMAAKLWGY